MPEMYCFGGWNGWVGSGGQRGRNSQRSKEAPYPPHTSASAALLPPAALQALASYSRCLERAPDSRNAGQNRLLALNYIYPGERR